MLTKKEVFSSSRNCPKVRLLSSYKVSDNGCWEYTNKLDRCGYGRFKLGIRSLGAHKISYVIHKGDVPLGFVVMHSCDNPKCINPDHLSLGTVKDNVHDCIEKGRFYSVGGKKRGKGKIIIGHNDKEMIVFGDIRDAEKHGFSNPCIYNCINGKRTTHKGYSWMSVERNQQAR